jgi:hypothetical protein
MFVTPSHSSRAEINWYTLPFHFLGSVLTLLSPLPSLLPLFLLFLL